MIRAIQDFMESSQQEVSNTRVNFYGSLLDSPDDDVQKELEITAEVRYFK